MATQKYIFKDDSYEPKIEDLNILKFYGCYNKAYIIRIHDINVDIDYAQMDTYIDGVLIKYMSCASYPGIVCWVKD